MKSSVKSLPAGLSVDDVREIAGIQTDLVRSWQDWNDRSESSDDLLEQPEPARRGSRKKKRSSPTSRTGKPQSSLTSSRERHSEVKELKDAVRSQQVQIDQLQGIVKTLLHREASAGAKSKPVHQPPKIEISSGDDKAATQVAKGPLVSPRQLSPNRVNTSPSRLAAFLLSAKYPSLSDSPATGVPEPRLPEPPPGSHVVLNAHGEPYELVDPHQKAVAFELRKVPPLRLPVELPARGRRLPSAGRTSGPSLAKSLTARLPPVSVYALPVAPHSARRSVSPLRAEVKDALAETGLYTTRGKAAARQGMQTLVLASAAAESRLGPAPPPPPPPPPIKIRGRGKLDLPAMGRAPSRDRFGSSGSRGYASSDTLKSKSASHPQPQPQSQPQQQPQQSAVGARGGPQRSAGHPRMPSIKAGFAPRPPAEIRTVADDDIFEDDSLLYSYDQSTPGRGVSGHSDGDDEVVIVEGEVTDAPYFEEIADEQADVRARPAHQSLHVPPQQHGHTQHHQQQSRRGPAAAGAIPSVVVTRETVPRRTGQQRPLAQRAVQQAHHRRISNVSSTSSSSGRGLAVMAPSAVSAARVAQHSTNVVAPVAMRSPQMQAEKASLSMVMDVSPLSLVTRTSSDFSISRLEEEHRVMQELELEDDEIAVDEDDDAADGDVDDVVGDAEADNDYGHDEFEPDAREAEPSDITEYPSAAETVPHSAESTSEPQPQQHAEAHQHHQDDAVALEILVDADASVESEPQLNLSVTGTATAPASPAADDAAAAAAAGSDASLSKPLTPAVGRMRPLSGPAAPAVAAIEVLKPPAARRRSLSAAWSEPPPQ